MHAKLEDWKNGWFGVKLGVAKEELNSLIAHLEMLRAEPDQHFHLTSNYKGTPGLGEITIYIQSPDEVHNMDLSSKALAPSKKCAE